MIMINSSDLIWGWKGSSKATQIRTQGPPGHNVVTALHCGFTDVKYL